MNLCFHQKKKSPVSTSSKQLHIHVFDVLNWHHERYLLSFKLAYRSVYSNPFLFVYMYKCKHVYNLSFLENLLSNRCRIVC